MERFIEIDGWTGNIRFSSCHLIPRHAKCSRLHGHTYSIKLRAYGEPDDDRMLADFGRVKEALRKLASELDHMTLIPGKSPDIKLSGGGDKENLEADICGKSYSIPASDVRVLPIASTTAEELSSYLLDRLLAEGVLPENLFRVELGVDEGVGQGAWSGRDLK